MKYLKKFESMYREKCDRCGEPVRGSATIMSKFNEDVICMKCKDLEKMDPEYDAACAAEVTSFLKGEKNYKGAIPNYKPIKN